MRRMYSEKELETIIHDVVGEYIEDGAFDEVISDAVDAYLEENPVDITALEGQDVELNSLDATGLVTGGEILEKMSGYSFTSSAVTNLAITPKYVSASKTGNKLTLVYFASVKRTGDVTQGASFGYFDIPASLDSKLFPETISGVNVLELKTIQAFQFLTTQVNINISLVKHAVVAGRIPLLIYNASNLIANTDYLFRFEATILFSDSLVS